MTSRLISVPGMGARVAIGAFALLLAGPVSTVASAQDASLEEIVVTATRREQNLQDTPISVAAFTFEDIELKGIEEIEDLNVMVPNAQFAGQNVQGEAQATFRIRGLGGVATYVDGIWQSSSANLLTRNIVELERIEVLRGPQGTLFGRNSTGGAVQLISKRPEAEFGGRATVSLGSLNQADGSVSVDLPLGDSVLSKWTGAILTRDGYVKSIEIDQSYGNVDNRILRGDILWTPTDNFSARAIIENNSFQQAPIARVIASMTGDLPVANSGRALHYNNVVAAGTNPDISEMISDANNTAGSPGGRVGAWENRSVLTGDGWTQDLTSVTLDMNWDINDSLSARSLSGWRENDRSTANDITGLQYDIFVLRSLNRDEQFTQEIQFLGEHDKFSYVVGAYYWDEKGYGAGWHWNYADFQGRLGGRGMAPTGDWAVCQCGFNPMFTPGRVVPAMGNGTEGKAIYFDVSLDVTDQLTLSAGYRDNSEETVAVSYANLNTFDPNLPVGALPEGSTVFNRTQTGQEEREQFDANTYRFTAQHRFTEDVMVYFSAADGWEPGVINTIDPVNDMILDPNGNVVAVPFFIEAAPQTVTNFEVGLRSEWAAGTLRLNGTLFSMDYDDIHFNTQIRDTYDASTGRFSGTLIQGNYLANAGTAKVEGAEVEFLWAPSPAWRFDLSLGWLDAHYTELDPDVLPGTVSIDTRFAGAPDRSAAFGIQHNTPLGDGGSLTTRLNYGWNDKMRMSTTESVNFDIPSLALTSLRINYNPPRGNYRLSLFGDNLTDEFYLQSTHAQTFVGVVLSSAGRPRQLGLEAQFFF